MDRRKVLGVGLATIAASLPFVRSKEARAQSGVVQAHGDSWKLSGAYFEACSCEVVCPCIFQSAPSHGDCSVLYTWHIDQGQSGDVSLDGLNVALAAYADGHMQKVKWKAALYIDERATPEQFAQLKRIFTGEAGGFPAALVGFFDGFLGVKQAPIVYMASGKTRSVDIPGIMQAKVHAIEGQAGGDTVVSGHPLGLAPGNPLIVAISDDVTLTDYEWNWKFSGRSGGYSPFQYQSS